MSAADLEVKVTGDAAGGVDALKKVQGELGRTAIAAVKTDSSLGKLKTGSNQATTALTNLGRVVQDAPFGFIGIANNINPLLESFQRLKAETGSAKQSFLALGSSLIGAGGLGIAVSVISSLLTVFAMNSRGSAEATQDHKKKVDETKKAAEEYAEALGRASSAVISHQGKLAELNKILVDTSNNFNTLSQSIVNQAAAQYLATQKEGIIKRLLDAKIEQMFKYKKVMSEVREFSADLFSKDPLKRAVAEAEADLKGLNNLVKDLKLDKLFSDVFKLDGDKSKDIRTISDVLAEMNDELRKLSAREILLNTNEAINKIKAMEDAFNELVEKFKLGTTSPIIVDLAFRINEAKARLAFSELLARTKLFGVAEREGEKNKLKIVVNVQPIFKTDPAGINKEAFKLGQEINEIVKNTFVDAFSGLGEAIGDALSGVSIGNAFDGIVKSLAGGLKAIGRKIIETNVQLAILKKIGFSNPAVGIAVGVAITALGAALQNAVSKQKAFATGVRNFEGGFAMVGERGPERVFLPKGSSVQPNNELSAFSGGGITLMPSIQYSGDGFRIMLDKVDKRWGRNN